MLKIQRIIFDFNLYDFLRRNLTKKNQYQVRKILPNNLTPIRTILIGCHFRAAGDKSK